MTVEIPVQNIYYLLCYAWNKLDESEIVDVNKIESTKLVNLFAKVLINGITHLLKRGIDKNYILCSQEISTIRGKIDLGISYRNQLFSRGKAYCTFDEFHHNILHNQILKTTIFNLIHVKDLDNHLREDLIRIYHYFHQIDKITLSPNIFSKVTLHRNNYFYYFLINICELLYQNLFISEEPNESKFRDFVRDENKMAYLFEEFIRNFYKIEQNRFAVRREDIFWNVTPDVKNLFPKMQTDISLESIDKKIIIDTKYYKDALQVHFDHESIRSSNLFQMYSYLKQGEYSSKINEKAEGIIIYPAVEKELLISTVLENHKITIATINLNQEWQLIHNSLLGLINISQN